MTSLSLNKNNKTNFMEEGFIISKDGSSEEVIHIPYNINNILVKEKDIIDLLARYNVNIEKVNKLEEIQKAFTHQSYLKKDIYPKKVLEQSKKEIDFPDLVELQSESYQRLEYFGDRVLKLTISMYLFYRYPQKNEGFMTRLQTKIEDKKNLAIFSQELGLQKYFLLSRQNELVKGRNSESINEDIFEAFIGALMLSNGFEVCFLLIVNLLETLIDYSEKLYRDNNYKDKLLQHFHKNQLGFPKYFLVCSEGPPHKRIFTMGVEDPKSKNKKKLETRGIGFGVGNSKKEAEQNASKMTLILYGVLNEDQFDQSDIFYPDWENVKKLNSPDEESPFIKKEDDIYDISNQIDNQELSDETSSESEDDF